MFGHPVSEPLVTVAKFFNHPMILSILSPIFVKNFVKIGLVVSEFGAFIFWVTPNSEPRGNATKFLPSLLYFRYLALYLCKIW